MQYPNDYDEEEQPTTTSNAQFLTNNYDDQGLSAPMGYGDGSEVGIIKELSPKKVLEQIRMKMKGFEYDYEKQDYIKIADPLMNDKGISKYLSILGSVISDVVTFSNYKAR